MHTFECISISSHLMVMITIIIIIRSWDDLSALRGTCIMHNKVKNC